MDLVTELERLSDLHRIGDLTADEYLAAKAALLTARLDGVGDGDARRTAAGRRDDVDEGFDEGDDDVWDVDDPDIAADDGLPGAPAGGRGGAWILSGLMTALFGLYQIGSAVVGGRGTSAMIDAQSRVAARWMTYGGGVVTDANGQPIELRGGAPSSLQPVYDAMDRSVGQAAGLQMLFGLGLVGLGGWQISRGTGRGAGGGVRFHFGPAPMPHHPFGPGLAPSRSRDLGRSATTIHTFGIGPGSYADLDADRDDPLD